MTLFKVFVARVRVTVLLRASNDRSILRSSRR